MLTMSILELIIIAVIVYFVVDLLLRVLGGKIAEDSLTMNDLLARFFSFAIGLVIIVIGIILYFKWN